MGRVPPSSAGLAFSHETLLLALEDGSAALALLRPHPDVAPLSEVIAQYCVQAHDDFSSQGHTLFS